MLLQFYTDHYIEYYGDFSSFSYYGTGMLEIQTGSESCDCDGNIDSDEDGVCDGEDQCLGFDDNIDIDSDGLADGCDACPADSENDHDYDQVS